MCYSLDDVDVDAAAAALDTEIHNIKTDLFRCLVYHYRHHRQNHHRHCHLRCCRPETAAKASTVRYH